VMDTAKASIDSPKAMNNIERRFIGMSLLYCLFIFAYAFLVKKVCIV
jgi:hypothetical protein